MHKLTKLQSEELAHAVYVALDTATSERESHETDLFLNEILSAVEARNICHLSAAQIAWLLDETDNLLSIAYHNHRAEGEGLALISSMTNLEGKVQRAATSKNLSQRSVTTTAAKMRQKETVAATGTKRAAGDCRLQRSNT